MNDPHGVNVEIVFHSCYECGVIFGMTKVMDDQRRRDGRSFYCCNGHEACYPDAVRRQERYKALQERQEEILQIHNAEQAEAKAEQAGALPPIPQAPIQDQLRRRGDRLLCPECDQSYKLRTGIRRHLRREHGYSPALADEWSMRPIAEA